MGDNVLEEVADLANRSLTTGRPRAVARDTRYVLMRVGDDDWQSHSLQAAKIVDVVADESELVATQIVTHAELVEGDKLVLACVGALDLQLAGTVKDYGIGFGRQDC